MIFDAHCYLGRNPVWEAQGMPATMHGKDMIAYMDQGGVDRALCAPPGVGVADHFAADHERIAQAIADYPDRIFGFARVKPPLGAQAIYEMHYWLRERGFHAVKFNTIDDSTYGAGCYSLADRALMDPVLEAIAALQVPVMIHTGEEHGHTCTPALVANLALDFPQITFIIAQSMRRSVIASGGSDANSAPGGEEGWLTNWRQASTSAVTSNSSRGAAVCAPTICPISSWTMP